MKINLVSTNKYENTHPKVFIDTIEAAHQLFKGAGFDVAKSVNYFNNDTINILWGAGTHKSHDLNEIRRVFDNKSTIIFNMEQVDSGSPLITDDYIKFLRDYVVFDYNQHNALELNLRGVMYAHEFPVQPIFKNRSIGYFTEIIKTFDLAFYGSLNERRANILSQLENNGVKIKYVGGVYGDDLLNNIVDCSAVLNIHHYENSTIFESARCLQPISMGIPVYSENSKRPIGFDWEEFGVFFARKNYLIPDIIQMVKNRMSRISHSNTATPNNERSISQVNFIIAKAIEEINRLHLAQQLPV